MTTNISKLQQNSTQFSWDELTFILTFVPCPPPSPPQPSTHPAKRESERDNKRFIAKLSQAPAKLNWDSFIITIPVVRVRVRHTE